LTPKWRGSGVSAREMERNSGLGEKGQGSPEDEIPPSSEGAPAFQLRLEKNGVSEFT